MIRQEGSEEGRPWSSKRERSKLPEGLKATEADTSLLLGSLGRGGGGERGRGLKGRHGKKEEGRGGGRRKGRGGEGMPWEDFISWLDICHTYFQRYLGKRSSDRKELALPNFFVK